MPPLQQLAASQVMNAGTETRPLSESTATYLIMCPLPRAKRHLTSLTLTHICNFHNDHSPSFVPPPEQPIGASISAMS